MLSDSLASRIRRIVGVALPWVFVAALAANIAITLEFHAGTSHSLRFSDSSELADLIDSTYPEMRHEYGVYAEMRRIAAGSTLALPSGHGFEPDRLAYLADVTVVEGEWYPGDLAGALDEVVTGRTIVNGHQITYQIVGGEPGEPYGAARAPWLVVLAPIRLLEAAR